MRLGNKSYRRATECQKIAETSHIVEIFRTLSCIVFLRVLQKLFRFL